MLQTAKKVRRLLPLMALGFALALAGFSVAAASARSVAPRLQVRDGEYIVRTGRTEYRFDAVWRTESLTHFRGAGNTDGVDVLAEQPERLERMRGYLLRALKVHDLGSVKQGGSDELETLRVLGYL
jgi:hypothetical protein